ncbi:uncharacterized protein [Primulina huaijiensis]|uniref:uncharacterized protein n=1 Tax=Primulina huaijiensis TaxID=1492673 RepID=UPI003CC70FB2
MNTQLVEILPREIKFVFEVKKQSSCAVHLANVTEQYVAFKVKTTSPKKYCVRPNVGIIKPNSTCDFTVTMQAQKYAPSEMLCKDKFLIQSTVVPFGTIEEEIVPSMFVKGGEKYIEETKIRVVLTSAPNSPPKQPVHGILKEEASHETLSPKEPHSPVLLPLNGVSKQEPSFETSVLEVQLSGGVENIPPPCMLKKKVKGTKTVNNSEESESPNIKDNMKSFPAKDEEYYIRNDDESKQVKDGEATKLLLSDNVEELKLKISALNSKLAEAECTIMKLRGENMRTICEKETLKAISRRKGGGRKVQVGFPPLFVCVVVLISLSAGFVFRC